MKANVMDVVYSISGWSLAMVISSILFTFIGLKIDTVLGTPPLFMIGFLILCFIISLVRLYETYKKMVK